MVCADDGAVDRVGASIPFGQLGQLFEHCIEHARLDSSSISTEDAVPLAVFVGEMAPLRSRARHPHHAFEIASILLGRAAATSSSAGRRGPISAHSSCVRPIRSSKRLSKWKP
jgi:hypothetical protein